MSDDFDMCGTCGQELNPPTFLPAPDAPGLWWYEHEPVPVEFFSANYSPHDVKLIEITGVRFLLKDLKPGWWTPAIKPKGPKE